MVSSRGHYKKTDDAAPTPSLASRPFGQRVGPILLVLLVLLALGWGLQNFGNYFVDDVSKAPGTGFDKDASSILTDSSKIDTGKASKWPSGSIEGNMVFGKKEIKKAGASYDASKKPKPGQRVKMHYTGRLLDGTEFDSSRKPTREPFVATIGVGQLIAGWDLGVPTMAIGERAILTIQPEYGYGARGAGALIPPNAVLEFDMELLDILG